MSLLGWPLAQLGAPVYDIPFLAEPIPHPALNFSAKRSPENRSELRRVVCLIGSKPGCKVVLPHGRIDPVHLAIFHDGQRWRAVNLVTRFGTLLNELPLEFEELSQGDVLTMGPWRCRFESQTPHQNGADSYSPFGLEPAPHATILEHMASRRILQPTRGACVIGRRTGCDVVVPDNDVSRVHALLFSYYGFPAIADLLTPNHTFVNDAPVQFRVLQNDDVIRVGETRFRVRLASGVSGDRIAKAAAAPIEEVAAKHDSSVVDLIDIKSTESAQRWKIAENMEKASRRS